MKQELKAIPSTAKSARPVAAGWLPGDDVATWLREWKHTLEQGSAVQFFAVASAMDDFSLAGVLLVPIDSRKVPDFSQRVHPLWEAEKGVFLLEQSDLSLGLLEHEIDHLFPHRYHFVHPVLGNVGFSAEDAIQPASLLVMPPPGERDWNAAIPGPPENPDMRGIAVSQPQSIDTLIDQAGSDIASKNDGGNNGLKDGPLGQAGAIGRGLAGGAILGLSKLGSLFGGGSGSAERAGEASAQQQSDKFMDWAQRNWEGLFNARKREVDRLLDKLKNNPDEGLKYALPLAGGEGGRGTAPPSTRLGRRSLNFSINASGGPADGWDLSYEHRLELEQQYREAAAREVRRGNHERAAYIYGNLLGDWHQAARVFEESGNYRKAVSVYLHKTQDIRSAAACYEKGEMLSQAADLYEQSGMWEKAGDLNAQMGKEHKARSLWIRAADAEPSVMKKAAVWSDKLGHDAVALELLDREWVRGYSASKIVEEMFRLLQRSSQVDGAIALGNRVLDHPHDIRGLPLEAKLQAIREAVQRWPDPLLQNWLNQEMWKRIENAVATAQPKASKLLKFLEDLAPEDRLMERDINRYTIPRKKFHSVVAKTPVGDLKPKEVVKIGTTGVWTSLCAMGEGVSFSGLDEDNVILGHWCSEECQSHRVLDSGVPNTLGRLDHIVLGKPVSRPNLRILHFTDLKKAYFHTEGVDRIRKHDALASVSNVVAVGAQVTSGDFVILRHTETSSLTVQCFTRHGDLVKAIPIEVITPSEADLRWHVVASESLIAFATMDFFACRNSTGMFSTVALSGNPVSLKVSPVDSDAFLIVVNGEVLFITYSGPGKPLETVNLYCGDPLDPPPVAGFLNDGSIVIGYRGGGVIYGNEDFLKPSARLLIATGHGIPSGVASCGPNQLMILTESGNLLHFEFNS